MIVLGIETATALCGVGLVGDEGLMAEYRLLRGLVHAEYLPGAVEKIIRDAGISQDRIDGIAVSIGPGSFTGLRIGLGLAKGLAYGWAKPLVAVPTMDGIVCQIPKICEWVCVLLVARKGEVFQGLFQQEANSYVRKDNYKIVERKRIGDNLPSGDILFLGEGAACYREDIAQKVKKGIFLPPLYSLPSGYGVAEKGRDLLEQGNTADVNTVAPLYLKRFQGAG